MTAEFVRDTAATAVVFGFFAAAWFGWAQDNPPKSWKKLLIAGSVVSLLIAIIGGVLAWRSWQDGTVLDADTSRTFGIIVGIEFAAAGLSAGALAVARRPDLISAWVALVVGIHLIPVAWLFQYPLVYVIGGLVTVVALAAIPVARSRSLAVSAVTGLGAGAVLLAGALVAVVAALFQQ